MAFVWQLAVLFFNQKTIIQGVILEGKPPKKREIVSTIRHFLIVIKTYFKKPLSDAKVIISYGDNQTQTITDEKGGFCIEFEGKKGQNVDIYLEGYSKPLQIIQTYPVDFSEQDFPVSVISDLDDTLMVSHTASFWKRVGTLLFIPPRKRKPVSFTTGLLGYIKEEGGQVYYISKSESNLFGIISSVIQDHKLPIGPLFLTSYLNHFELLNPGKGHDYKANSIKDIFTFSAEKKFILIGDDTQADTTVYSSIAKQYPERIVKVYIRRTKRNLSPQKKTYIARFYKMNTPFLYFTDEDDLTKEIKWILNNK